MSGVPGNTSTPADLPVVEGLIDHCRDTAVVAEQPVRARQALQLGHLSLPRAAKQSEPRGARHALRLKRAYERPEAGEGVRVLVDRLWPGGLSKERLAADLWLKDLAPSDALRRWYGHDRATSCTDTKSAPIASDQWALGGSGCLAVNQDRCSTSNHMPGACGTS